MLDKHAKICSNSFLNNFNLKSTVVDFHCAFVSAADFISAPTQKPRKYIFLGRLIKLPPHYATVSDKFSFFLFVFLDRFTTKTK